MKRRNSRRIFIVLLLLWPLCINAQNGIPSADEDHIDLTVFFKGGSTVILPNYSGNKMCIDAFVQKAQTLQRNPDIFLTRITALGSASPDSTEQGNMNLSRGRSEVIFKYLDPYISLPPHLWKPAYIGEDWDGLLDTLRESDKYYKREVEDIILNTPAKIVKNGKAIGGRKDVLKNLDGGKIWLDMQKTLFPKQRQVTVQLFYGHAKPVEPDTVYIRELDTVYVDRIVTVEKPVEQVAKPIRNWKPLFAVKTNLLYDLAMVPTIGIEIPMGNQVSLAASWSYSWWNKDEKQFYDRTYGGDVDLRFWFGSANKRNGRLSGHHIGPYGQMFTADYLFGKLGMKTGYLVDEWTYAAGLEYGYSFFINKNLHLDLSVGAGHLWGQYKEYKPYQDPETGEYLYLYKATRDFPAVFPTKAEASLVWVIGSSHRK